jgi:hypothetical protein
VAVAEQRPDLGRARPQRATRQESSAYHPAASAWAITVPHAEPSSPACTPNTRTDSPATLRIFALIAIRSGVRVSSRPVMCPLPA